MSSSTASPHGSGASRGPDDPLLAPDGVAAALVAFINSGIMARSCPIGPEDDLQAAGVDSMGMLKILLFIEAEFGFWMPDEDLREEHLRSAWTLASYVCRFRNASTT
jgi:acyl carrier protein